MSTRWVRLLVIALAALIIAGLLIFMFTRASTTRPFEPITPYSERFYAETQIFNTDTGVFREREYNAAVNSELSTPSNGRLIINPILLPEKEEKVPGVQQSSYRIENTLSNNLYNRLTNSKRSHNRTGQVPTVAVLSLEYFDAADNQSWQSLTLYNVASKEELVDSALLFAPSSTNAITSWRGNVSLFLIDGALTSHAAALLPGVNILNNSLEDGSATGVIYTNRPFTIGGLPSITQDRQALEALESAYASRSLEDPETLRMDISQHITGTDLIFTAPEGRQLLSSIQAPASLNNRTNNLSIEGGVIAVDRGVTLVMGSGEIGGANSLLGRNTVGTSHSGTITLTPRAIIVDGGTLVLSNTDRNGIVLNTSIQVRNGGILKIGDNVTINGNIYAFGGGTVEVLGSFFLNGNAVAVAPGATLSSNNQTAQVSASASEQVPGGIFIFGPNSTQADGTQLGSGNFYARVFWLIDGYDGVGPLYMSRAVHFLSTEGPSGYKLMYSDYKCTSADNDSYLCTHLGSPEGEDGATVKLGFSADMAVIEVLVPTG